MGDEGQKGGIPHFFGDIGNYGAGVEGSAGWSNTNIQKHVENNSVVGHTLILSRSFSRFRNNLIKILWGGIRKWRKTIVLDLGENTFFFILSLLSGAICVFRELCSFVISVFKAKQIFQFNLIPTIFYFDSFTYTCLNYFCLIHI